MCARDQAIFYSLMEVMMDLLNLPLTLYNKVFLKTLILFSIVVNGLKEILTPKWHSVLLIWVIKQSMCEGNKYRKAERINIISWFPVIEIYVYNYLFYLNTCCKFRHTNRLV